MTFAGWRPLVTGLFSVVRGRYASAILVTGPHPAARDRQSEKIPFISLAGAIALIAVFVLIK